jgi:hypothetical protein
MISASSFYALGVHSTLDHTLVLACSPSKPTTPPTLVIYYLQGKAAGESWAWYRALWPIVRHRSCPPLYRAPDSPSDACHTVELRVNVETQLWPSDVAEPQSVFVPMDNHHICLILGRARSPTAEKRREDDAADDGGEQRDSDGIWNVCDWIAETELQKNVPKLELATLPQLSLAEVCKIIESTLGISKVARGHDLVLSWTHADSSRLPAFPTFVSAASAQSDASRPAPEKRQSWEFSLGGAQESADLVAGLVYVPPYVEDGCSLEVRTCRHCADDFSDSSGQHFYDVGSFPCRQLRASPLRRRIGMDLWYRYPQRFMDTWTSIAVTFADTLRSSWNLVKAVCTADRSSRPARVSRSRRVCTFSQDTFAQWIICSFI